MSTPADISGCVLWLRTDDSTYYSTDPTATTGGIALSDWTKIGRMFDARAASTTYATQSTTVLQPYLRMPVTFTATATNGSAVLTNISVAVPFTASTTINVNTITPSTTVGMRTGMYLFGSGLRTNIWPLIYDITGGVVSMSGNAASTVSNSSCTAFPFSYNWTVTGQYLAAPTQITSIAGNTGNVTLSNTWTGPTGTYTFTAGGANGLPFLSFDNTPADNATNYTAATGATGTLTMPASFLTSLDTGGGSAGTGSYTILWLMTDSAFGGAFHCFAANTTSGGAKFNFLRITNGVPTTNAFERYSISSTAVMPTANGAGITAVAYVCSMSSANNGTETIRVNSVQTPGSNSSSYFSRTGAVTATNSSTWSIGGYQATGSTPALGMAGGQFYSMVIYNRALSTSEIAQVYAYWNSVYNLSLDTASGPLTAGTVSVTNVTKSGFTVSSTTPTGGTAPYTYQWYMSTSPGNLGSAVPGATSLTYTASGLSAGTTQYYTLQITDGAAATVSSTQKTATTHGAYTIYIGFVGDSIIAGNGTSGGSATPYNQYCSQLFAAYPGYDPQPLNYAAAGATVYGTTSSVAASIADMQAKGCKVAIVMIGTNDANNQLSSPVGGVTYDESSFITRYQSVVNQLIAGGITPICQDIMWRSTTAAQPIIQAYNADILSIATNTSGAKVGSSQNNPTYSDYTYFSTHTGELYDGLHCNDTGAASLGRLWMSSSTPYVLQIYPLSSTVSRRGSNNRSGSRSEALP